MGQKCYQINTIKKNVLNTTLLHWSSVACRSLEGVGVIQDNIYAHMWGDIATSNGNENGATLTDIAASKMTYDDISAAQKLARECLAKNYKDC